MRKQYKNKKGGGCALCKPHKHGWAKRWKATELAERSVLVAITVYQAELEIDGLQVLNGSLADLMEK